MFRNLNIDHINVLTGGMLLVLTVVLFMISIPHTEAWRNFRNGRNALASAYVLLGLLVMASGMMQTGTSDLTGLITLVVAYFQAVIYTKVCVIFIKPRTLRDMDYKALLAASAVYSTVLAVCFATDATVYRWAFHIGIGLYTVLLVYCTMLFRRNYREALKHMEYVYDEDMRYSLLWVKGCFYSALTVGVMVWFMIVWHDSKTLGLLGIILYTVYYMCMIGYFTRYVNKYSFILRTDDNRCPATWPARPSAQPSAQEPGQQPAQPPVSRPSHPSHSSRSSHPSSPTPSLADRLDQWARERKYRENYNTVDDIVRELKTTRRALSDYMTCTYGTNFRTWRNRLRIEDARHLMEERHLTVAEACDTVGYTDRSNFHRHFTELVGMTPSQYRKKVMGMDDGGA